MIIVGFEEVGNNEFLSVKVPGDEVLTICYIP